MEDTAARGTETISWRVHPARQRIGAALAAGTVILALSSLAAVTMQSPWWGIFSVVFLFVALDRFFLPSEFSIDGDGVVAHCGLSRRACRWRDIRRFNHDGHGGHLSTRVRSSALDSFRGIHLVFGENREAVVARIERCLAKDRQPCSG